MDKTVKCVFCASIVDPENSEISIFTVPKDGSVWHYHKECMKKDLTELKELNSRKRSGHYLLLWDSKGI